MDEWLKLHLAGGEYDGDEIASDAVLLETHRPQTIIPLQPPWSLMAPEAHFLTYSLMYRVFDHYLGALERGLPDWSAEPREQYSQLLAAGEAQQKEVEDSRAQGTSPSLPLAAYAGTYRHPMFGDLDLSLQDGTLVARPAAAWVGDLEHWHHDTFQVHWRDDMLGEHLLTVRLDAMGEPVAIALQGLEGVFQRVPETTEG